MVKETKAELLKAIKLLWLVLTTISSIPIIFIISADEAIIRRVSELLSSSHNNASCIFCGMTSAGIAIKNLELAEAFGLNAVSIVYIFMVLFSLIILLFTYMNKKVRRKLWQF